MTAFHSILRVFLVIFNPKTQMDSAAIIILPAYQLMLPTSTWACNTFLLHLSIDQAEKVEARTFFELRERVVKEKCFLVM